ncbi:MULTISPECIES: RidA family protein [Vibrio]|uniref:Reactive intermediate/imine deaminase n=2 Tax=Vibrio TaxID=662 RepID=A0A4Y3HZ31_9VIBR|nr:MULTISPECIES: RidA family protein [Vibrio]GEA52281.1 reactive intermediate/imine deaminase [Vibrio inusitatus NBRC 102082]GEA62121.1 reactive intermediate/imine deaminase [Vibrio comitans NBRC 102076]
MKKLKSLIVTTVLSLSSLNVLASSVVLHSDQAPAAIGPYVQGIDLGGVVITSGQIPVNPATGEVSDDIKEQTKQSLENVRAVIEQAGLTPEHIVKMTVFVKDLNDFAKVNEVYGEFFDSHNVKNYPTRSTVEVARLPRDVGIEIEAIAIKK